MTTTSATSSIVSTLGAGSGIDMAALATSLATAQFANRIDRNTTRADTVDRQISAASTLKSQLLQLASSVGERVRSGDLSAQPSIANGVVAVATRGVASGSGSYTLEVSALAASQVLTSPAYADPDSAAGSGTLTLRFGTIANGSFTATAGRAASEITIPGGATLNDVASAINAAGTGVSAYVATGADGARLMLKGQEGAANAFVLETAPATGGEALANLAWNPAGDASRQLGSAADAAFKLDGLAMTSPFNALSEIVPGLNLRLTGKNPGSPTQISFSDASSAVTTFMQDLTSALNELVATLNADVDPKNGDLARDDGARSLRRAMSQLAGTVVMPGAAAGQPRTLADLGLATERGGTFRLDTTRLAATLNSAPAAVSAMFTTGFDGVYATLDKLGRTMSAASDPGSLAGSLARLTKQQTELATEKTELADKQEKLRQQLTARFARVDTRVSASQSTLTFLKAQIAAWNNTNGN